MRVKMIVEATAVAGMLLAGAAHGQDCQQVGPGDGEVSFVIDQAGSPFTGRFQDFGGTVCVEGDSITRVEAWVDPASVEAGLPEIENALRGSEFFAVDEHPRATFESADIRKADGHFIARGTLQIKGIRKTVDVPFDLTDDGGARHLQGTLELPRLDFDVGTGEWADTRWVGEIATVRFSGRVE